jgi:hypothetical protein
MIPRMRTPSENKHAGSKETRFFFHGVVFSRRVDVVIDVVVVRVGKVVVVIKPESVTVVFIIVHTVTVIDARFFHSRGVRSFCVAGIRTSAHRAPSREVQPQHERAAVFVVVASRYTVRRFVCVMRPGVRVHRAHAQVIARLVHL